MWVDVGVCVGVGGGSGVDYIYVTRAAGDRSAADSSCVTGSATGGVGGGGKMEGGVQR